MQTLTGKLVARIPRTDSVESFRFRPTAPIDFQPGQFVKVLFDENQINSPELNKTLSFSAPPQSGFIEVTKRLSSSAFSGRLRSLNPGDDVRFLAPLGKCVYLDDYRKICFLTGGIGITPVMAIIGYIVAKQLATDVVLLFTNRSQDDIPFKPELDQFCRNNTRIKIVYTVDQKAPTDPHIHFGRIDAALIKKAIPDFQDRTVFSYGPPGMVGAMKQLSLDLGCPEGQLFTENFIGY